MERYYFEQDYSTESKKYECIFFDRELLSDECVKCDNCKGFNKNEKWIDCLLYDSSFHIWKLAMEIDHLKHLISEREDRLSFLNKKLLNAYLELNEMKEHFGELDSRGGY